MTQVVRFRDTEHGRDKMLKVTLNIQRTETPGPRGDDVIHMYEDDTHHDMVRVVYSTPEWKKSSEFYLTTSKAMSYIHDTLKTLTHDSQPFEYVQVSTSIHPTVLYHVLDLDCNDVRYLIEETVEAALRQPVFRVKKQ
jgi:hypothetical protein